MFKSLFMMLTVISAVTCKSRSNSEASLLNHRDGTVNVDVEWANKMQKSLDDTKTAIGTLEDSANKLLDASGTEGIIDAVTTFNNQLGGIATLLNSSIVDLIVKLNAPLYSGNSSFAKIQGSEFVSLANNLSTMSTSGIPLLHNTSARYALMVNDANTSRSALREAERNLFRAITDLVTQSQNAMTVIEAWVNLAQNGGGNNPNQPRRERYVLEGFYVTGNVDDSNQIRAQQSWQQNCDQSVQAIKAQLNDTGVGEKNIESYSCGTMQNASRYTNIGYFLYGSAATATVVIDGDIINQEGLQIVGDDTDNKVEAYRTWREKCYAHSKTIKTRYPTVVAAMCGLPKNVSSYANINYNQFASTAKIWLKTDGNQNDIQTISDLQIVGAEVEKNVGKATDNWNVSCNDARKFYQDAFGAKIQTFECGKPSNGSAHAGISYISYLSNPIIKATIPADSVVQSGNVLTGSEVDKNIYQAWSTWWTSCKSELTKAKAQWAERFVFGTCGVPSNISQYTSIGYVKYSSTPKIWLQPIR